MTEAAGWIDTLSFAQLAQISRQKGHRALARSLAGHLWHGFPLEVRVVTGHRGQAGIGYQVRLRSLPAELRIKYESEHGAAPSPIALAPRKIDDQWEHRMRWIMPAIEAYRRGERWWPVLRDDVAPLPGAPPLGTMGKWMRRYLDGKAHALMRKKRADAGHFAAVITRSWQAFVDAAGVPREKQLEVEALVRRRANSFYAKPGMTDRNASIFLSKYLADLTRAAGVAATEEQAARVCLVPRHVARKSRRFKIVATKRADAKAFHDRHDARIRRDASTLKPMEIVAGDVHAIDIEFRPGDGKEQVRIRAVAWLDFGTNRLFASIYFLRPGEGIRQEHVIKSFIDMTQDQAWGVPASLYLDNGSEYNWAEMVADLATCANLIGRPIETDLGSPHRPVTRSRPYRPTGKVIETRFSALARGPFRMIPGFKGGDIQSKKTENLGRLPTPFMGSEDELRSAIAKAIAYHNAVPLTAGVFKGRIPDSIYEAHVRAGHQRVDVDRYALSAVFAEDNTPIVRHGAVTIGAVTYYGDSLARFAGERVHVRVPKIGDRSRIAHIGDDGQVLGFLAIDEPMPFTGDKGPKERARRSRLIRGGVSEKAAETEPVDLVAEMAKIAAPKDAVPVAASAGRVGVALIAQNEAAARRALPPPKARKDRTTDRQRRQVAALIGYGKAPTTDAPEPDAPAERARDRASLAQRRQVEALGGFVGKEKLHGQ